VLLGGFIDGEPDADVDGDIEDPDASFGVGRRRGRRDVDAPPPRLVLPARR
jgi:hypothetical protein